MPDAQVRSLGIYMAYVTIPRTDADDDRWRWYNAGRGRVASLRPDNMGTIRATLSFLGDVRGIEELAPEDQALVIRRTFADAGWETGRVLDALAQTPFYFDAVGQVRLPRWSRGRIALVGDAAYCASPVSGMGTSLALVGAYVLAGELGQASDGLSAEHVDGALARYANVMRPYVDKCQAMPAGIDGYAPKSKSDIVITATVMKWMQRWPLRSYAAKKFFTTADSIELPDYSQAAR
jgi:2-polyprenyl-6-methoxyphenol hydroxylase-like FAD-dependent oxidoreductase